MSPVLIIVISLLISLGIAAVFFFTRIKTWYLLLLIGLFSFLSLLFVFDLKIDLHVKKRGYPPPYLLLDRSISQGDLSPRIINLLKKIPKDKVFRYPQQDSNHRTALYDWIQASLEQMPPHSPLLVISDFNDNHSFSQPGYNSRVIPVIHEIPHDDSYALVDIIFEEKVQAGRNTPLEIISFSRYEQSIRLKIQNKNNILHDLTFTHPEGIHTRKINLPVSGTGYQKIDLRLEGPQDPWISNNHSSLLQSVLPDKYRIFLIAGRPSSEVAALRRFLDSLRWVHVDSRIIVRKGEKVTLPAPNETRKYDALILVDIADRQFQDLDKLRNYPLPVLYLPGMRKHMEILRLKQVFGLDTLKEKPQETTLEYLGEKQVIATGFDSPQSILNRQNRIIFLGWNTWRWDFIQLALSLDLDYYRSFWKNMLIDLLRQDEHPFLQDRLNYLCGEPNPLDENSAGLYTYRTNGQDFSYLIREPIREKGLLYADRISARQFNTNIITFNKDMDWDNLLEQLKGKDKMVWEETRSFHIRSSPVVFITLFVLLVLTWFLHDRLILKS